MKKTRRNKLAEVERVVEANFNLTFYHENKQGRRELHSFLLGMRSAEAINSNESKVYKFLQQTIDNFDVLYSEARKRVVEHAIKKENCNEA